MSPEFVRRMFTQIISVNFAFVIEPLEREKEKKKKKKWATTHQLLKFIIKMRKLIKYECVRDMKMNC